MFLHWQFLDFNSMSKKGKNLSGKEKLRVVTAVLAHISMLKRS